MKSEKFKIVSMVGGHKKIKIWDSSKPMAIDPDFKWILEKGGNADDGPQIRHLTDNLQGTQPDQFTRRDLGGGAFQVEILRSLKLEVSHLKSIPAAYTFKEKKAAQGNLHLVAFSGSGKGLTEFKVVPSAYIAYVRRKPVFTLLSSSEGYQVRPLLPGVQIKMKNQKSVLGQSGDVWKLDADQIVGCTVFRSSRWWRFNFVTEAGHAAQGEFAKKGLVSPENQFFKRLMFGMAAFMLVCTAGILSRPVPVAVKPEQKEAPIVKFVVPPPVKKTVVAIQDSAVKPSVPVPVKKPEIKEIKAKPTPQKIVTKTEKVTPHQGLQASSARNMASIREALGGVMQLTKKSPVLVLDKPSSMDGMFNASGNSLKPTELKAEYSGSKARVQGIAEGKSVVSYAQGDQVNVRTKGNAFISVNDGGMAVEKGLLPQEVGAVIHSNMDDVRACHGTALLSKPDLQGRVLIDFSISPSGRVEKADIHTSTVGDTELEKCLITKLKGWAFPKPKGGVHVAVSYPFMFRVLDQ